MNEELKKMIVALKVAKDNLADCRQEYEDLSEQQGTCPANLMDELDDHINDCLCSIDSWETVIEDRIDQLAGMVR